MCTGNVYCSEIRHSAVLQLASCLNVLPETIEQAAHVYEYSVYESYWQDLVYSQNLDPNHPQTVYRELLDLKQLIIWESHAGSRQEFELTNKFSRR